MSSAGSSAFPASTLLARRALVQTLPFQGMRPAPFSVEQVQHVSEIASGYVASKGDFADALRDQQMQMASDLRELGFSDVARHTESRLGMNQRSQQRDH